MDFLTQRFTTVEGILLESHLIQLMRLKLLCKLEIVSINLNQNGETVSKNDKGEPFENILELKNFKIIQFAGYLEPESERPRRNTLYIPISRQYPGFDFVYYEMSLNAAFFVNVTKQENAFIHIVHNDKKAKKDKRIKSTIKVKKFLRVSQKFFKKFKSLNYL